MTTVDEILDARPPSLSDRARWAFDCAESERKRALSEQREELFWEFSDFLQNELRCSEAEVNDAEFTGGFHNPRTVNLTTEIGGVTLRARFRWLKVMDKKSSEFASEEIRERVLLVEVGKKQQFSAEWKEIKTLADLGKELA